MITIFPILLVVALIFFLVLRGATSKRQLTPADHYHWIVRSLAALLAVSAVAATAIGTWRGTGMAEDSRPFSVSIPTRPPPPMETGPTSSHWPITRFNVMIPNSPRWKTPTPPSFRRLWDVRPP